MRLVPKEVQFSDNFEKLADKIEEGGKLLTEILDDFADLEAKSLKMKEIEHEADDIANIIYRDLHTTFITPLDREDIFQGRKKQVFVPFTSRDGLHKLDTGKL